MNLTPLQKAVDPLLEKALCLVRDIDELTFQAAMTNVQDLEIAITLVELRNAIYRVLEAARSVRQ